MYLPITASMMVKALNLIALLMLAMACGGTHSSGPVRSIASITETEATIVQDIEDKLIQIHIYQVIGQNELLISDKQADAKPIYLKLQAIKTQIEKVEIKITDIVNELKQDTKNKNSKRKLKAIFSMIDNFAKKSTIHAYSVEKLKGHLEIAHKGTLKELSRSELEKEIALLRSSNQYQVFEQNIEHLSFMLESNKTVDASRISLESSWPNRKI